LIVLDTHVWLWWRGDPKLLSKAARAAIESSDAIGISVMSCFEVARLADEERISLAMDVRTWIRHALAGERVRLIGLDAEVAVTAALLDRRRFPGDPADRMIFASARALGARLVTKDRRLRAFAESSTVW
jgi:PIN domain nuclease of toxin-antitoxin system